MSEHPRLRAETAAPAAAPGPDRGFAVLRLHGPPSLRRLSRRRRTVRLAKLVLPAVALALLSALVLWPQLSGQDTAARLDVAAAQVVPGDTVYGARYHGIDRQDRPYTVTAARARRAGPDRINLRAPQGSLRLKAGDTVTLEARRGVYRQAEHALDLSRDVTLYRDDGTTLITASAAIDLRRGAAAGAAPVHATGPFGVLSAQGGFTLLDKGADIQFAGPARLVLNGATK